MDHWVSHCIVLHSMALYCCICVFSGCLVRMSVSGSLGVWMAVQSSVQVTHTPHMLDSQCFS